MGKYLEIDDELKKKIISHYSRPEIIKSILSDSKNKEVVGSYGGVGYSKRPDILEYENDLKILVKKGVTSFHVSEETWRNPLSLRPGMSKKDLNSLRIAWDLIIDIDCPHWEISKLITQLLVNEIKNQGVRNVSVKFSGNKGFHIGVPNECFGDSYAVDFPELPRKICEFLLSQIFEESKKKIVEILVRDYGDNYFEKLETIFEKPRSELIVNDELNPIAIIEVDTIMLNPRHLYRMTYSVNEKSGLVSIPINPDHVLLFDKNIAKIENNIYSRFSFLDRSLSVKGEADKLLYNAIESKSPEIFKDEINRQFEDLNEKSDAELEYEEFHEYIPEKYFPDSIVKFLEAKYNDGKKRALFVLKNFLASVGWKFEEIEKRLIEWNSNFEEPLRESVLKGQLFNLKNQLKQGRIMMPPNFENNSYYDEIIGDVIDYKKAKNPVTLAIRRFKLNSEDKTKSSKSKKSNTSKNKTVDN